MIQLRVAVYVDDCYYSFCFVVVVADDVIICLHCELCIHDYIGKITIIYTNHNKSNHSFLKTIYRKMT